MHSWRNRIAPWLAPALLCGIALAQFIYTQISSLSPWKGGGFGMFSTVDSPGARFLKIHLLTPEGEIPVFVPSEMRAQANKLRTLASERLAAEFAEAVANGIWVKVRLVSAIDHYQRSLQRLGGDEAPQDFSPELARANQSKAADIEFDSRKFVRMAKKDEVLSNDKERVDVRNVRVELWKYAFDKASVALSAERYLVVTSTAAR